MKNLLNYTEQGITNALEKTGAFFAFGQKQFNEQKKEGVTYVSMGSGLICPEENAAELNELLENNYINGIKTDVAENGAAAIIEREYFNYETQLTGDKENLKDELQEYFKLFPELFTEELFKQTCKKAFATAVENNWF